MGRAVVASSALPEGSSQGLVSGINPLGILTPYKYTAYIATSFEWKSIKQLELQFTGLGDGHAWGPRPASDVGTAAAAAGDGSLVPTL